MAGTAVLEKILNVREKEKDDAQMEKNKAVESFEKVAQQLYKELKRKEEAESEFATAMKVSATITMIKEQSNYISLMNKNIYSLQLRVQQARQAMEEKQDALTEAYVEVKKIKRLIELRKEEVDELSRKQEMSLMDEISIRQFQK